MLANSMESNSSSKVKSYRITHHLRNSRIHCHVCKITPVLRQINQVHSLTPCCFRIHNHSLLSTSPNGQFPLCFKTKIEYALRISPNMCYFPCLLTHLDLMISGKEFKSWIFSSHLLPFPDSHFPSCFRTKIVYALQISPNICYLPSLSHMPWFNYRNDKWQRVQIMKLIIGVFTFLSLSPPYVEISSSTPLTNDLHLLICKTTPHIRQPTSQSSIFMKIEKVDLKLCTIIKPTATIWKIRKKCYSY